jgi:hypothetical protein
MGETGCGKTLLIKKLNQILNNGNELLEIINIHPGVTDEILNKFMDKINDKAKNIKKELWILFDEINTCSSFSMITEIFINRTYKGKTLEDNIRLIGTCNPFRQKRYEDENEDENEDDILVYKVNQLPQSLFYYIFKFGEIYDEDEKIYIDNIIQKLFDKDEEKLHKLTTEAISQCHKFLRHNYQDPSIVSLRDISRFIKIVEFFQDYYQKKNNLGQIDDDIKKLYKIKSIICSIYLCYYIRLKDEDERSIFDHTLQKSLLNIVNVYSEEKDEDKDREGDLYSKIKYGRLRDDFREHNFRYFSDLLRIEEEFLLDQIELDEGIGKNQLLKENLFLLFISIITKIPLIIVDKPGAIKTISTQLIYNSMRGKYSKNEFFKKYPQIIQIYFKGSYSTKPEDIVNLFNEVENSIEQNVSKDIIPINMIIFDQIDLVERSPTNPLKILNYKLEFDNKNENISKDNNPPIRKNIVKKRIHNYNNKGNKKMVNVLKDNLNKHETNNIQENNNKTNQLLNIVKNKNTIIEKVEEIMKFTDKELNELSYDLALKYDTRIYSQYTFSLFRTKHNFIFAFFYSNDYNSKIIKLDLFFISFSIFYTVNALFFNDHTMHKIYITEGKFNLEYQLPKIIYSSLISMVLNSILKLLSLSNKGISELKQNKSKEEINSSKKELENKLKIKFVLYFMISFMLLFFFWYYISLFGVIYRNTQLHLLKDTLISFGLSLIYPFAIYLLPGLLRIPSLSNPKKKKRCLYQLSKILQIL